MSRSIRYLVCVIPLAVVFSSCCKPALIGSLAVQRHPQETSNWCWAASSQMVMDYLSHNVSRCTEANNRFGCTDCCSLDLCPSSTETPQYAAAGNCIGCPCPGWSEFDKYGFTFKRTSNTAFSWEVLKAQLSNEPFCKRKPSAFSWPWVGHGGHIMVVKGYVTVAGTNYVDILDPWGRVWGREDHYLCRLCRSCWPLSVAGTISTTSPIREGNSHANPYHVSCSVHARVAGGNHVLPAGFG